MHSPLDQDLPSHHAPCTHKGQIPIQKEYYLVEDIIIMIVTRIGTNADFFFEHLAIKMNERSNVCCLDVLRFTFPTCSFWDLLSITNLHNEALAKSGHEIKFLFCKDKLRNSTFVKFFACSSSGTCPLIAECERGWTFKCNFITNECSNNGTFVQH